jgi:hypothetical protein
MPRTLKRLILEIIFLDVTGCGRRICAFRRVNLHCQEKHSGQEETKSKNP